MSEISKKAIEYVKQHKNLLIDTFASLEKHDPSNKPAVILMAGAPGAGKTELANQLKMFFSDKKRVQEFYNKNVEPINAVHIDPDQIRQELPGYTGTNANEFQFPVSAAIDKIIDHCYKYKLSFILDGTLASDSVAEKNILRALSHDRNVLVCYLYDDPKESWNFTQLREIDDGRRTEKQAFIDAYFKSIENVDLIREKYDGQVNIWFAQHAKKRGEAYKFKIGVKSVKSHIPVDYSADELYSQLPNDIQ